MSRPATRKAQTEPPAIKGSAAPKKSAKRYFPPSLDDRAVRWVGKFGSVNGFRSKETAVEFCLGRLPNQLKLCAYDERPSGLDRYRAMGFHPLNPTWPTPWAVSVGSNGTPSKSSVVRRLRRELHWTGLKVADLRETGASDELPVFTTSR